MNSDEEYRQRKTEGLDRGAESLLKRTIYILLFLIVAAAICLGIVRATLKSGTTIRVTETQINKSLAKKFPVEKTHLKIIHTRLDQPRVQLHHDQDTMQIEATAQVSQYSNRLNLARSRSAPTKPVPRPRRC